MSENDDIEIDQLLAGGRLSGRQYDEIGQSVLRQVTPRRSRRWWPVLGGITALASALSAWLLISRTGPFAGADGGAAPNSFSEKGGDAPAPGAPIFDVRCATPTGACRVGDTLMVSVHAVARGGYLAGYAERADDMQHPRIWYFPSESGESPRVEAVAGTLIVPRGLVLAAPHAPGRYEVTLWLSEDPPQRVAPVKEARRVLTLTISD